jgi:small subunit ribosomal protein S16
MGSKGKPYYRVVVADSRCARDGRFIENIGSYDPRSEPAAIKIDEEKALLWLTRGAQPTDTAAALLKKVEIYQKFLAGKTTAAPVAEAPAEVESKPAAKRRAKVATAETTEVAEVAVEEQSS